jgi:hypothetical protein
VEPYVTFYKSISKERRGQIMDQQQGQMGNIWLPLVAAVGAGAATFYSMTRQNGQNGQNGQNQNMLQQVSSFAQDLTNQKQGQNQ